MILGDWITSWPDLTTTGFSTMFPSYSSWYFITLQTTDRVIKRNPISWHLVACPFFAFLHTFYSILSFLVILAVPSPRPARNGRTDVRRRTSSWGVGPTKQISLFEATWSQKHDVSWCLCRTNGAVVGKSRRLNSRRKFYARLVLSNIIPTRLTFRGYGCSGGDELSEISINP